RAMAEGAFPGSGGAPSETRSEAQAIVWYADAEERDEAYAATFAATSGSGFAETSRSGGPDLEAGLEAALIDDRVAVSGPVDNAAQARSAGSAVGAANLPRTGAAPSPGSGPATSLRFGAEQAPVERHDVDDPEIKAVPAVGGIPIQLPPLELLDEPGRPLHDREEVLKEHRSRVTQIDETLANFKLGGRVVAA